MKKLTQKEIKRGLSDYHNFLNGRIKERTPLTKMVLAKMEKDVEVYKKNKSNGK